MTPDDFKTIQADLGWTNGRMATFLRKSEQTVSNYRNARQRIPDHVETLLEIAQSTQRDAQSSRSTG